MSKIENYRNMLNNLNEKGKFLVEEDIILAKQLERIVKTYDELEKSIENIKNSDDKTKIDKLKEQIDDCFLEEDLKEELRNKLSEEIKKFEETSEIDKLYNNIAHEISIVQDLEEEIRKDSWKENGYRSRINGLKSRINNEIENLPDDFPEDLKEDLKNKLSSISKKKDDISQIDDEINILPYGKIDLKEFVGIDETLLETIKKYNSQVEKINELKVGLLDETQKDNLRDEYIANLYYLIEIKKDILDKINTKKNELNSKREDIVQRRNIAMRNYLQSYSGGINNKKYQEEYLQLDKELDKIDRELNTLNRLENTIKISAEEKKFIENLDKTGLTAKQQEIYDNIKGIKKEKDPETAVSKGQEKPLTKEPSEKTPIVKTPNDNNGDNNEEEQNKGSEIGRDEEPVKVVKTTPWQWIKDHKKQILIALGLTALAVSVVVIVTQLMPALLAAQQATQVSGLFSQMMSNAGLWHTSMLERGALHAANTSLASHISALTGMSNVYSGATGLWTIGGQALPTAAKTAALAASKAHAAVGLLKGVTLGAGIGGIGTLGAGLLLSNRSSAYKTINSEIKELKSNIDSLSDDEFREKYEKINKSLNESKELSNNEKKVLYSRLQKLLMKRQKLASKLSIDPEDLEEENTHSNNPETSDEKIEEENTRSNNPETSNENIEEENTRSNGPEISSEEARHVSGREGDFDVNDIDSILNIFDDEHKKMHGRR